jgi:hypothetical protein
MSKWSSQGATMKKGALANPENAPKMKMQQKREVKLRQQKPSETIASGKEKNVLFESRFTLYTEGTIYLHMHI